MALAAGRPVRGGGAGAPAFTAAVRGALARADRRGPRARERGGRPGDPRAQPPGAPFVVIDCAAADAQDVDRELFGTRSRAESTRGSRRGRRVVGDAARAGRHGLSEALLDLPAATQRRLARILRDREVTSGGRRVPVRARIIGEAPASVAVEVGEGHFRSDLFRRLSQTCIAVPGLRERPEDIPELAVRIAAELRGGEARRVHAGGADGAVGAGVARQSRRAARRCSTASCARRRTDPSGRKTSWRTCRSTARSRASRRDQPARGAPAVRAGVHRLGARASPVADERSRAHPRHRARQPLSQDPATRYHAARWGAAGVMSACASRLAVAAVGAGHWSCRQRSACAGQDPTRAAGHDRRSVRCGSRPSILLKDMGVDNNVFNEPVDPKRDFTFTLTPSAEVRLPHAPAAARYVTTRRNTSTTGSITASAATNTSSARPHGLRPRAARSRTAPSRASNSRSAPERRSRRPRAAPRPRLRRRRRVQDRVAHEPAGQRHADGTVAFDDGCEEFRGVDLRDSFNGRTRASTPASRSR